MTPLHAGHDPQDWQSRHEVARDWLGQTFSVPSVRLGRFRNENKIENWGWVTDVKSCCRLQIDLKPPPLKPIQVVGMDSTLNACRRIVSPLTMVLLSIGMLGCTTSSLAPGTAPHSTVSRDNAVALAKLVAASIGGRVYAIAPSGSMLPTLDEGSIVTVEKVPLAKLHQGDIIIYRNAAGMAVIHRLYERHDDRWYVLGDNNASVDRELVSAGNFIGRVCAIFYTESKTVPTKTTPLAPELTAIASSWESTPRAR